VTIEVHIEWAGATHLVGVLHPASRGPSTAFEYAIAWLQRADAFAIDPIALPLQPGGHHAAALFSALQDCGPDRWGRVLVDRAVRKGVIERRPHRDLDYVLALDDGSRIGALRFSEPGGPFLAVTTGRLPPIVRLAALLRAADAIHQESESAADLRFLLGEGSPLGGARPKSAVVLPDGTLAIAKFRKPDDTRDIAAGEILALGLANRAGISTAAHRLFPVGKSHAAVITRFDRVANKRVPFVSAATLIGTTERDAGSYVAIAEAIRRFGDDVGKDLAELWRRMAFSLLVCNSDDHLRNHAFLMRGAGKWSLSPAYDINPVPEIDRGHGQQTPLSEDRSDFSIDHAMAIAASFGLTAARARTILRELVEVIGDWRQVARKLKLSGPIVAVYASAFEHEVMDEARTVARG